MESAAANGRPFDTVLMLGVAAGSPYWRVERCGRNADESRTDVDGYTPPGGPIDPEGPEIIDVSQPVDLLVQELKQSGLPATATSSAGGFLCNHVLYRTLALCRDLVPAPLCGFLHVPADEATYAAGSPEGAVFPWTWEIDALQSVLEALSRAQRDGEPAE